MAYKLLILFTFLIFMSIAGYYLYRYLNEKLKQSNTWLGILLYAAFLFVALGALLAGGIYVLVNVYTFLVAPE